MFDSTFSLIMIAQDTMISIENFIYDIIYLENLKIIRLVNVIFTTTVHILRHRFTYTV